MALFANIFELMCNNFGSATQLMRFILFAHMSTNTNSTSTIQPSFHFKNICWNKLNENLVSQGH
jgi:hypothetical protein